MKIIVAMVERRGRMRTRINASSRSRTRQTKMFWVVTTTMRTLRFPIQKDSSGI